MSEPEIYFNGVKLDNKEQLNEIADAWQDAMVEQELAIAKEFNVSDQTASAILYLRSRSRYTTEKEQTLIDRDHKGNPIPLNTVLSGEF